MDPFSIKTRASDMDVSSSEKGDLDSLLLDEELYVSLGMYLADLTNTMEDSDSMQEDDMIPTTKHGALPRTPASPTTIKGKADDNFSKKRMSWTPEEEALLRELQARYGNDWLKISRGIPGRSEFSCRTRWYSHIVSPTKTVQRKKDSKTLIQKKKTVRALEIDLTCKEQLDPPSNPALLTTFPSFANVPFVKFSFSSARALSLKRSKS